MSRVLRGEWRRGHRGQTDLEGANRYLHVYHIEHRMHKLDEILLLFYQNDSDLSLRKRFRLGGYKRIFRKCGWSFRKNRLDKFCFFRSENSCRLKMNGCLVGIDVVGLLLRAIVQAGNLCRHWKSFFGGILRGLLWGVDCFLWGFLVGFFILEFESNIYVWRETVGK